MDAKRDSVGSKDVTLFFLWILQFKYVEVGDAKEK